MLLNDARIDQILFLSLFLILGLTTRDWTLQPSIVLVAIATCLTMQWGMGIVMAQVRQGGPQNGLLTRQLKTMQHKFALIPQLLLPEREQGQIGSPASVLGEGLKPAAYQKRGRANAFTTVAESIVIATNLAITGDRSDAVKSPLTTLSNLLKPFLSTLITALGLSLLLRVDHYTTMMLASAVAIASKFLIQINGKHIFNPANVGMIAALTLTHDAWVSPGQWGESGWYVLLFLATGGIVLRRVGRWDTTVAFLVTYAGLEAVRNAWLGWTWDVWAHRLMSGSLLLFALFMITDPRTIPNARFGRLLWAMTIACLTFILRNQFFISTGMIWALFILAPVSLLLDAIWVAPQFAWNREGCAVTTGQINLSNQLTTFPPP